MKYCNYIIKSLCKLRTYILLMPALALTGTAYSDAQKNQLKQEIQQARTQLHNNRNSQKNSKKQLAAIETKLGRLQQQRSRNKNKQRTTKKIINNLQQQINQQANIIKQQQQLLAKQWQTAAPLLRQPAIKYLLNKNNIASERLLTYTHAISAKCLASIKKLQQLQQQQSQQLQAVQKQRSKLLLLALQQRQQDQSLRQQQQKRQLLLKAITVRIKNKRAQLRQLLQDQKQLNQTVKRLFRHKVKTGHFAQLHGKLSWPTNGRITRRFGTRIEKSKLKLKGVLIKAPAGQSIIAVHAGKVVFARWLSGYGQLIIIDHGKGYMTLYGRVQQILVKVGEQIKQGTSIATVGNSGGFAQPALYFAIRRQNQALNPALWCSTSLSKSSLA